MDDVAIRRRQAALVIAALLAVLLVSVAALLWTQQAKAQEPCSESFCIDKTVNDSTPTVGQQITFTITERCFGDSSAECTAFAALVDTLPDGLSINSVDANAPLQPEYQCTTSGNTVTCPPNRISTPDQPFTLTIVATTGTECGEFTNMATKSSGQTAQASFTVEGCGPTIPTTKEECKKGGWSNLGWPDQGTCISAWNNQNRP
jgi:uncharacterized repeat protein (TIGR01451 family)